jgi:alpha-D-xyloside xylohydrolase
MSPLIHFVLAAAVAGSLATRVHGQESCPGDCQGDGVVTVDEIVVGVSIGLGSSAIEACTAADGNVDGSVTVDEILRAIQAALSGCSSVRQAVTLGETGTLRFDAGTPDLVLRWDGTRVLRILLEEVRLGAVDVIEDATNYDPYPLVAGLPLSRSPVNLRWLSGRRARITKDEPNRLLAEVSFDEGKQATLEIRRTADGSFRLHLVPQAGGPPVAYFRIGMRADADEGFYGLGEYFDAVNHRGRIRAMQLEVDTSIESTNNEAHVPIPFLIGTKGWGAFVESRHPGVFDVATQGSRLVEATFGTGAASGDGIVLYLFSSAHPLDVTRQYYEATTYPKLPARWAYGPWVWRDENDDQTQVETDAETIRDLDLATSAMWIDRPYATGVNAFDFDPEKFPQPRAMIERLNALGMRVALWHTPYVDEQDADTADLVAEANANGYFPLRSSLRLNGWGRPIDFTNPQAFGWWQDNLSSYLDLGIEGFKLDYGEDIVPGIAGRRNVWQFRDGSDERTMHSGYKLLYHGVYAELLGDDGGFLLCRAGTWGTQQYPCVIWPGDLDANMAKHREVVTSGESSYVAVGGLPAAVVASLSLGPSGFPFFGSDTGGYRHSPPDKETFTRWFQHTALSSVMQIGTSTNDVAWEFNEQNGFDEEMLGWYRDYTRLHLRLFPYVWSYAERLDDDGRPILRALGLAHPETGVHPDDIYLLGDDLLVAPVVTRGARSREVTFPQGDWIDWWTGEILPGGGTSSVAAPLGTLPLYQRAGSIVPLLRPTIDTLSPTTQPALVDSYATTPGALHARVVFGESSEFEVYDGTRLTQAGSGAGGELGFTAGAEFAAGAVFEVVPFAASVSGVSVESRALTQRASVAELEQSEDGWFLDETGPGRLWVKVGAGGGTAVVAAE